VLAPCPNEPVPVPVGPPLEFSAPPGTFEEVEAVQHETEPGVQVRAGSNEAARSEEREAAAVERRKRGDEYLASLARPRTDEDEFNRLESERRDAVPALSDGRISVLAERAGGKCVGAPATRDEERAMAVEIQSRRRYGVAVGDIVKHKISGQVAEVVAVDRSVRVSFCLDEVENKCTVFSWFEKNVEVVPTGSGAP
jgi:hypothetical protein